MIVRGWFGSPVITPDGQWLVAAKCRGENWGTPHDLVRVRLADRREDRVDLAPADHLDALAWMPAYRKVLVQREDERVPNIESPAGPEASKFFLLHPATGEFTEVSGDFRPYLARAMPKLQVASTVDEVWAALPSPPEKAPGTSVGRYNTRTFTFVERLKVPGVRFESKDMWMEETKHRLTFTINGDMLRLNLPE